VVIPGRLSRESASGFSILECWLVEQADKKLRITIG
jgi:hypothetical protein